MFQIPGEIDVHCIFFLIILVHDSKMLFLCRIFMAVYSLLHEVQGYNYVTMFARVSHYCASIISLAGLWFY